jgi:F-type H+-transporting ATPase subunit b
MTHRKRFLCALAILLVAAAPLFAATEEAEHASSWGPTIAKIVNFAALVGILVYFFRNGVATYLRDRSATIRKGLVDAAALRATAQAQLTAVQERLAKLPGDLEELKRRGAEELAAEKVRQAEATKFERDRVLEQTRREIELQSRLARRQLLEHSASLSMKLARQRLEKELTTEDQQRLIDRYSAEVRA